MRRSRRGQQPQQRHGASTGRGGLWLRPCTILEGPLEPAPADDGQTEQSGKGRVQVAEQPSQCARHRSRAPRDLRSAHGYISSHQTPPPASSELYLLQGLSLPIISSLAIHPQTSSTSSSDVKVEHLQSIIPDLQASRSYWTTGKLHFWFSSRITPYRLHVSVNIIPHRSLPHK